MAAMNRFRLRLRRGRQGGWGEDVASSFRWVKVNLSGLGYSFINIVE